MNIATPLAEYTLHFDLLSFSQDKLEYFDSLLFRELSPWKRREEISKGIIECVQKAPDRSFLLPAVVDLIRTVRKKIDPEFTFADFETHLGFIVHDIDEELIIRGKIVGRVVPRDSYQHIFPIGGGKVFEGVHVVTAHSSPDLDTTVASFWGWVDAFAAKVSLQGHRWNVPGGIPETLVEVDLFFTKIFGPEFFEILGTNLGILSLSAKDLMTIKNGVYLHVDHEQTNQFQHEREQSAVIIVSKDGEYLGDYRSIDQEGITQLLMLFNGVIRSFEARIQSSLIDLFSQVSIDKRRIEEEIFLLAQTPINTIVQEMQLTYRQEKQLDLFIKEILLAPQGLEVRFIELARVLEAQEIIHFEDFQQATFSLFNHELYDKKGMLLSERCLSIAALKVFFHALRGLFNEIQTALGTFAVALRVKEKVFGHIPNSISPETSLEEIREKIAGYPSLTVTVQDGNKLFPIGVVFSSHLQKHILATVSLRDFCNRDEVKIPSYFEVISVVDHHKVIIETKSPLTISVSDAQSSNVAMFENTWQINSLYSTSGIDEGRIEKAIVAYGEQPKNLHSLRILSRFIDKKLATARTVGKCYVAANREYLEYLHYLVAIFDDTDLLSKATKRDLVTVANLLSSMKSIAVKDEVLLFDLDVLLEDPQFSQKMGKILLDQQDCASLSKMIYASKEALVEKHLQAASEGHPSIIFEDAKVFSSRSRVSQTKLFASNIPTMLRLEKDLIAAWVKLSKAFYQSHEHIGLYVHMISTVPGGQGALVGGRPHKDALWIWIPDTDVAFQQASYFIRGLIESLSRYQLQVELPKKHTRLRQLFERISHVSLEETNEETEVARILFAPGMLNSRKSKVVPYLPS